ncbi:hypothetical protein COOONC_16137 [Cooperia oncophora]
MFSNSSSFFGTSSVLKEQDVLRETERHRAKRSSVRKQSLGIGSHINVRKFIKILAFHEIQNGLTRLRTRVRTVAGMRLSSLTLVDEEATVEVVVFTHQYTADPTLAWEMLKEKRPVKPVRQMKLDTPIRPDHVRFVCIGCTHGVKIDPANLPPGDVLLVAGDFTSCGLPNEVSSFNKKLGQLKHPYKVVIAGNHECTFDDSFLRASSRELHAKEMALRQALLSSLSSSTSR